MLLQIICNPNDQYQLNLRYSKKHKSYKPRHPSDSRYSSSRSRYLDSRDYQIEEEEVKTPAAQMGTCEFQKPNDTLLSNAKHIFYKLGNALPTNPSVSDFTYGLNTQRQSLLNNLATKSSEVQSIKLASLFLYVARLLHPIFENHLVYLTSLDGKGDRFPNMGTSEKRVVGAKLTHLFTFLKNEENKLQVLDREDKDIRRYTRQDPYEGHRYEGTLNYENILEKEAEQIQQLKTFVFRSIIAIEFIDEISKDTNDFKEAIKRMGSEEAKIFENLQFRDLTLDITNDPNFNSFVKKLLEVKAEGCKDLKEAKRMCETWNKKCGVFVDREFINVFIAEFQLQKMLDSNMVNDEIFNMSMNELKRYPTKFEVEKVVYLLIKLNKVQELVCLLCIRFLFIQEYEEQESKYATSRDHSIKFDYSYYRKEENMCVHPILEILERLYSTYVEKVDASKASFNIFKHYLEFKTERSIYDYLEEEIWRKLTVPSIVNMKTHLIDSILLHDSEKLHNIILSWMEEKELYEDLDKVTSKYYNKFIEKFENESRLDTAKISLVYKYLLKTKDYHRAVNFLIPIISCDTSDERSRVVGNLSIQQRLLYVDNVLNACEAVSKSNNYRQNLDNIIKSMEETKNTLLIQSDIENLLRTFMKHDIHPNEEKRIKSKIAELNSKIFEPIDLVQNVTQPMKLFDITINILRSHVLKTGKITEDIRLDVMDCYRNIIDFYANDFKHKYPGECYNKLESLANLYYTDEVEHTKKMIPVKKCNDTLKNCFFPIEEILMYVHHFNKHVFGEQVSNPEKMDEAMDDHKIKHTPYWFIGLLLQINQDCLSYVIKTLYKNYKETKYISTLCDLVVGIRKYKNKVDDIGSAPTDLTERNIVAEYNQYTLSLNQIVKELLEYLDQQDTTATLNPSLQNKLYDMLSNVAKKQVVKKPGPGPLPTIAEVSSPLKFDRKQGYSIANEQEAPQAENYSFHGSSAPESKPKPKPMKLIIEEEKGKEEQKEAEAESSFSEDEEFVRNKPKRRRESPEKPQPAPPAPSFGLTPPRKF